MGINW